MKCPKCGEKMDWEATPQDGGLYSWHCPDCGEWVTDVEGLE